MNAPVDPFTAEVIRHALTAIAEEMSLVVIRSARSPLLREAGDLSSALTGAEGELIAQGRDIPIHMGVMAATVKEFLKRVPTRRLAPGDVWLLNLPEIGGNHLPDVKAIRPIHVNGMLQAFAVSLAHWADIGGALPGSYVPDAIDAWQEGLRIPPFRVFSANGPDREKLDMILANLRGPEEREGDILAQVAATRTAEQRFRDLVGRHGAPTVQAAIAALHDHHHPEAELISSGLRGENCPPWFKDGACVIMVDGEGRIAMQLRDDKPGMRGADCWGLFGGFMEAGETPEQTVVRELREELEVELDPSRLALMTVQPTPSGIKSRVFSYQLDGELSSAVLHEGQRYDLVARGEIDAGHFQGKRIVPNQLALMEHFWSAG